jgi:hypothetical protein
MRLAIIRMIALIGMLAMLVVIGLQLAALNVESGDLVLYLSYTNFGIGILTTVSGILWAVWSPRKVGGILVAVFSLILNPAWLILLVVLVFG